MPLQPGSRPRPAPPLFVGRCCGPVVSVQCPEMLCCELRALKAPTSVLKQEQLEACVDKILYERLHMLLQCTAKGQTESYLWNKGFRRCFKYWGIF